MEREAHAKPLIDTPAQHFLPVSCFERIYLKLYNMADVLTGSHPSSFKPFRGNLHDTTSPSTTPDQLSLDDKTKQIIRTLVQGINTDTQSDLTEAICLYFASQQSLHDNASKSQKRSKTSASGTTPSFSTKRRRSNRFTGRSEFETEDAGQKYMMSGALRPGDEPISLPNKYDDFVYDKQTRDRSRYLATEPTRHPSTSEAA